MPDKAFFDTNVLIYAVAGNDPRSERSEALLSFGGIISVQVLNEFVSVARRKLRMSWPEVREALDAIRVLCGAPVPLTVETHESALDISEQYGYEIYDASVIAAALNAKCLTLFSEDLQDGQKIVGRLTIRNPYR